MIYLNQIQKTPLGANPAVFKDYSWFKNWLENQVASETESRFAASKACTLAFQPSPNPIKSKVQFKSPNFR